MSGLTIGGASIGLGTSRTTGAGAGGGGGAASSGVRLQTSASTATGTSFCQRTPNHRNASSSACIAIASAIAPALPGSLGIEYGTAVLIRGRVASLLGGQSYAVDAEL